MLKNYLSAIYVIIFVLCEEKTYGASFFLDLL
jgi:hypothetical protein